MNKNINFLCKIVLVLGLSFQIGFAEPEPTLVLPPRKKVWLPKYCINRFKDSIRIIAPQISKSACTLYNW